MGLMLSMIEPVKMLLLVRINRLVYPKDLFKKIRKNNRLNRLDEKTSKLVLENT